MEIKDLMDKGIRKDRGELNDSDRQVQLLTQENLSMKRKL
jgi:hypothetical protein